MSNKPVRLVSEGKPGAGMVLSHLTSPEAFTSENKSELISHHFTTDDESILTGVWECAPCKEVIDAYPVHEMMTVLDGSVTLTDAEGGVETYGKGDTFFIPKGTACTWEITQTLRKFYMIAAV